MHCLILLIILWIFAGKIRLLGPALRENSKENWREIKERKFLEEVTMGAHHPSAWIPRRGTAMVGPNNYCKNSEFPSLFIWGYLKIQKLNLWLRKEGNKGNLRSKETKEERRKKKESEAKKISSMKWTSNKGCSTLVCMPKMGPTLFQVLLEFRIQILNVLSSAKWAQEKRYSSNGET